MKYIKCIYQFDKIHFSAVVNIRTCKLILLDNKVWLLYKAKEARHIRINVYIKELKKDHIYLCFFSLFCLSVHGNKDVGLSLPLYYHKSLLHHVYGFA